MSITCQMCLAQKWSSDLDLHRKDFCQTWGSSCARSVLWFYHSFSVNIDIDRESPFCEDYDETYQPVLKAAGRVSSRDLHAPKLLFPRHPLNAL